MGNPPGRPPPSALRTPVASCSNCLISRAGRRISNWRGSAPSRSVTPPAAWQRPRPDARMCGGRVDEDVGHPHPSQTRMCRFPASGSSWESLARGGVDDTIRDSSGKKGREGGNPTSLRSRQYSYPLSFRGQVCETQSSLPCFPSTVLSTWHPSFLDRVPVSPVPRCHRYY